MSRDRGILTSITLDIYFTKVELKMNKCIDNSKTTRLWISFRDGDNGAFSELYNNVYPEMYIYGCKLKVNHEQIKDIIHDLFFKLYAKPDIITNPDTLRAFLFTSVKNACINQTINACKHISINEVTDLDYLMTIENRILEDREGEDDIRQTVNHILGGLTPHQRRIINLRFLRQMDYTEIALIMNISEQSARNLIHRTIALIRKKNPQCTKFS